MKVVISAGHQPGLDSGAVGKGRIEANDNIAIADRVVLLLRSWGADVDYMPNNVGNLQGEINWMAARYKTYESALAVQIHRNAGGGTGNEVWTAKYRNQWDYATKIMKAMTKYTGMPERGVKDIATNPLGWINFVNCASVLVECRFIDRDNITDASALEDAMGIAAGIADCIGIKVGKTPEQIANEQKAAEAARLAAEAKAKAEAEAKKKAEAEAKARAEAEKKAAEAEAARIAAEKAKQEADAAQKAKEEAEKDIANTVRENNTMLKEILKYVKSIWGLVMNLFKKLK